MPIAHACNKLSPLPHTKDSSVAPNGITVNNHEIIPSPLHLREM